MVAVYVLLAFLPIAVFLVFKVWGKQLRKRAGTSDSADRGLSPYERERNIALNISPLLLKLNIPNDETLVYGVVAEMDMGEGFMTLACYITGAANLYFSTGGGLRGGGKNPRVGEASVELVTDAQDYLSMARSTRVIEPPVKGFLTIYLLTNQGKFIARDETRYVEDNSSPWLSLFEKCSKVIAEMHKINNAGVNG